MENPIEFLKRWEGDAEARIRHAVHIDMLKFLTRVTLSELLSADQSNAAKYQDALNILKD